MRHRTCLGNGQCRPAPNCQTLFDSLIVFQNRHISGALAELIRSTRAPTKDRLIGKNMGGNPAFRGTASAATCSPSCALARARAHAVTGEPKRLRFRKAGPARIVEGPGRA